MKIGDKVSWSSQSGGFWKVKIGTVVEIVPPGIRPRGLGLVGLGRKFESYIVEVPNKKKGSKKYWPNQSMLEFYNG